MSGVTTEVENMLAAGAIVPPDTDGAGEQAVPFTARTYQHPVLGERVVVRLVDADLGVGEDTAMGFLGLNRVDEPATVGLGLRQALGFPEWVLVHHPDDGHHALAVMPELQRIAKQAWSKPKAALDAYHALAGRLDRSVPHFLPTFYEQAGRVFLAADQDAYAAQMFNRARKAETEHGLEIDPDRLDAVYLEFALAKAVSVSALAGYAKDLAARLPAEAALDRFCVLAIRSAGAGLVPSTQVSTAIRRLVRAAGKAGGKDGLAAAEARERAYLRELLGLPVLAEVPISWWQANLPALVVLAEDDRAVRGVLLNLMHDDRNELPQWLDVLTETGAIAGLYDGGLPVAERPEDGSVGWLRRFLKAVGYAPTRQPALLELVERSADQLRGELGTTGETIDPGADLDLLDLLLSLDIPVRVPGDRTQLNLTGWSRGEGQRDLVALAGDTRFHAAFRQAADRFGTGDSGTVRQLVATPGGRVLFGDWLRAKVRTSFAVGLPHLPEAVQQLLWLPGEALTLAADEIANAATTDLAEQVTRSLRGGVLDELCWPAWEEALAEVGQERQIRMDAWPYMILMGATRVCVIGAEGIVLRHDLRIPHNDVWGEPGCHYVDGDLLVYWDSRELGGHLRGYWHSSAEAPQPLLGNRNRNQPRTGSITLALPGGGRTTGRGVLHAGDTAVPDEREVITDGTSYWVYRSDTRDERGWHEYDPATGAVGRRSLPGFLADALRTAPVGSTLSESESWLRPALSDRATSAAVPVDGLLGWRVVRLPDGSTRGEDLAGRTVTVPSGIPIGAVALPGDDRPRALLSNHTLVDPDGVVSSVAGSPKSRNHPPEAAPLPWQEFAGNLVARDPAGSTALRRIDRDSVASLFKAAIEAYAAEQAAAKAKEAAQTTNPASGTAQPAAVDDQPDPLTELVRSVLPQISHDGLVAGVVGVLRFAARLQPDLDKLAKGLAAALTGAPPNPDEEALTGPTDEQLGEALDGLTKLSQWSWNREPANTFRQLRAISRAQEGTTTTDATTASEGAPAALEVRLHLDGPDIPDTVVRWPDFLDRSGAVAYRAALATTPAEHQQTLRALLAELDGLGLTTATEPARWRRLVLHLEESHLKSAEDHRKGRSRGILSLADGAFLMVLEQRKVDSGYHFTTLFHDPTGVFDVPAPYTVPSSQPVGETRPAGWLATFLTEWAERGPAPWRPEAAEKFAELTGVTLTTAKLVLAGMFQVDSERPLPAEVRKTLAVKAAEIRIAFDTLGAVNVGIRRAVASALLPAEPSRLWTDGPDVMAAAEMWNRSEGRRVSVPEELLVGATKSLRTNWGPDQALPALLDPTAAPELSNDLSWVIQHDRAQPADHHAKGFTGQVLTSTIPLIAWAAHELPAGHPFRAALPAALAAVRDRLANPALLLDLNRYVRLSSFRKVAGAPSETGAGWERYGAVIMATGDDQPSPALRVVLLDEDGSDPYLPALRGDSQQPFEIEAALWTARDPKFAALLADPGEPVAGTRDPDGTWWPQDPTRSVPELVAEVTAEHGLSSDAAAVYLMLLAMPDPTDRNVARWTGWKPARLKAARAELAGTDLVVEATRSRAGRTLFLPGAWLARSSPHVPIEQWKAVLFGVSGDGEAPLGVTVPVEPVPDFYRRAWQRLRDGDVPHFEQLRHSGKRR
ncbi:hypothetical protein ACWDV4_09085 [Micromonospora sp. NPDC003197]